MTNEQKLRGCIGLILFLGGVATGVVTRPEQQDTSTQVLASYSELQTQFAGLAESCARPQKGEVVITSKHVIDAVRGKQLEFVVNTTTEE